MRRMLKLNHSGFTLIELMLAMGLFSIILVVSTTGFIGINQTYTRAAVKKQLSESVIRLSNEATASMRTPQSAEFLECSQTGSSASGCLVGWNAVCVSGTRFVWKNVFPEDGGLFRDLRECDDENIDDLVEVVDQRFVVETFKIVPLLNNLYQAKGVIRTSDKAAFTVGDDNIPITELDSYEPRNLRCRGSSAGSVVRSCAVESFNILVNSEVQSL